MVPRLTLILLAFCVSVTLALAAPSSGRSGSGGNYDKPQAPAMVQKTITVEVMTPDGAWELKIDEIRRVQDELWIFAKVSRPKDAIGAMMVSAASDQLSGRFPDLPIKTFVEGKTWTWKNDEVVTWLTSAASAERRRQGQRLWRR